MNRKHIIAIVIAIIFIISLFFFFTRENKIGSEIKNKNIGEPAHWMNIQVLDINSRETFSISELKSSNKPIFLESFAVWCPTCLKQQQEIKKFHESSGDLFISVSLDTDPNEDEEIVKEHADKHGFNWRYAISPEEMTLSLIDEFGIGIVNAPNAPLILICNNESFRMKSGVKTSQFLMQEIESKCGG